MRQLDQAAVAKALCAQTEDVREAGFTDVIIGLSGGLDSSVVATLAVEALGADHVHGVLMPGPYTSASSIKDASQLALNLGIDAPAFPITQTFAAFCIEWEACLEEPLEGLAAENTQARLRMCILMALSNAKGWMVLNTGNLSEAAMGYSTLYGDTAGALAPIGGLYKTEVFQLAAFLNQQAEAAGKVAPIPQNVLTKPPSAELSEEQTDEASLGISYGELDELLWQMVDQNIPAADISPEAERIWKRYQQNAFKRAQEPPFAQVIS